MSFFYRFFGKSTDEATINLKKGDFTIDEGNLNITTGTATITAGNLVVTAGTSYVGSYQTVAGTMRTNTAPLYLGTGTVGIAWGAAIDPWKGQAVTIPSLDKGSLYIQTTYGTVYVKTGYATTAWATVTVS